MIKVWSEIMLLMSAVAFNTIPRWYENHFWYYEGQAVSILVWIIAARIKTKHKIINLIWDWCILLALNNAYDEFFGNPKETGLVEISVSILITLWTLYKIGKCSKITPK